MEEANKESTSSTVHSKGIIKRFLYRRNVSGDWNRRLV